MVGAQNSSLQSALGVWLIALSSFALTVWLSWTGFLGSDDALYADAAIRWLHHGPFVGTSHFSLRLTTVLPVVLSFRLLGVGEFTLILPTLLCGLAITAIFVILAMRVAGTPRALFAVTLFVTAPLFASMNSSSGVDLTELVFDLSSLCLFVVAIGTSRRAGLLFLCGLLVGLGWTSRETSIFLALYYGLLFLTEFRIPRREYLLIAVGFLTIALGEMFVYYLLTGDAFHRLKISLHHDLVDRSSVHSLFDREGNLHINGALGVILNPLLMIFLNKIFGIVFWLEIPAAIWLFRSRDIPDDARVALQATTAAGLVWMLGVFLMIGKLYLVPRYILFPLCTGCLLVGAWIAFYVVPCSRRTAFFIVAVALAINLLAINLEDHNFLFPERVLVDYAKTTSKEIYTDHETLRRAAFLLSCAGILDRITERQHKIGDLFFYVPDNASFQQRVTGHEVTTHVADISYAPLSGEVIVAKFDRPERWLATMTEALGASRFVPPSLLTKMRGNQRAVFVYAVPAAGRPHSAN